MIITAIALIYNIIRKSLKFILYTFPKRVYLGLKVLYKWTKIIFIKLFIPKRKIVKISKR